MKLAGESGSGSEGYDTVLAPAPSPADALQARWMGEYDTCTKGALRHEDREQNMADC